MDELPQLVNILKGDMSLIGPRPAPPQFVDEMSEENLRRHLVLPGITGLVAIHEAEAPALDDRLRLDLLYVSNWSLLLDAKIFFKTIYIILLNKRPFNGHSIKMIKPESGSGREGK